MYIAKIVHFVGRLPKVIKSIIDRWCWCRNFNCNKFIFNWDSNKNRLIEMNLVSLGNISIILLKYLTWCHSHNPTHAHTHTHYVPSLTSTFFSDSMSEKWHITDINDHHIWQLIAFESKQKLSCNHTIWHQALVKSGHCTQF